MNVAIIKISRPVMPVNNKTNVAIIAMANLINKV